jgi:4-oxalocrotonate tautomerase
MPQVSTQEFERLPLRVHTFLADGGFYSCGIERDESPTEPKPQKTGDKKMPLVNIEIIENVFSPEQGKEMIKKVTDAMMSIEGEALREYTLVKIDEIKEGNRRVGGKTLDASDVHRIQRAKVA